MSIYAVVFLYVICSTYNTTLVTGNWQLDIHYIGVVGKREKNGCRVSRKIEAFDPATEEWGRYIDRFQQFLVVNDVKDPKKQAACLTDNSNRGIDL